MWLPFTQKNMEKLVKDQDNPDLLFVCVTKHGRSYIGRVQAVTPNYVELQNGPDYELLYFKQHDGMRCGTILAPAGVKFDYEERLI